MSCSQTIDNLEFFQIFFVELCSKIKSFILSQSKKKKKIILNGRCGQFRINKDIKKTGKLINFIFFKVNAINSIFDQDCTAFGAGTHHFARAFLHHYYTLNGIGRRKMWKYT